MVRTTHSKLLTPGPGNDAPPFYAELIDWQGKGFFARIEHGGTYYTLPHPNLDCPRELYKTTEEAKAAMAAKLSNLEAIPSAAYRKTIA